MQFRTPHDLRASNPDVVTDANDLMIMQIDTNTNGSPSYVGYAPPGTTFDQGFWRIKKFVYDQNGLIIGTRWAGGDAKMNYVWNDRNSYTYG
ncbi:MAG: hypothetical protein HQL95_00605 [Magnetococcales bacterium]|nr:hypothetical protein [Magnetococcales bacterium]